MAKVKMKRTLKRGVEIFHADYDDAKYFYAGYKKGAFDEYFKPEKDLSPRDFANVLAEYCQYATATYTAKFRLPEENKDDDPKFGPPLALAHTTSVDNRMEVHVIWMPWATPRNKIEVVVQFLKEMGETHTVLTTASEKNKSFFFHIRKYGVMRFVGEVRKYFDNETGYIFQGVS